MLTLLLAARRTPRAALGRRDAALGAPFRDVVDARGDDARHPRGADQDRGARHGGGRHRHVRGRRADRAHSRRSWSPSMPASSGTGSNGPTANCRGRAPAGMPRRGAAAMTAAAADRRAGRTRVVRGLPAAVAARQRRASRATAAAAARSSNSATTRRSRTPGRSSSPRRSATSRPTLLPVLNTTTLGDIGGRHDPERRGVSLHVGVVAARARSCWSRA